MIIRQQTNMFLYQIFRGPIDSTYLLDSFDVHVSSRLIRCLGSILAHIPSCGVKMEWNAIASGVFARISRLVNIFLDFSPDIDTFCDPSDCLAEDVAAFRATRPVFGVMLYVLYCNVFGTWAITRFTSVDFSCY